MPSASIPRSFSTISTTHLAEKPIRLIGDAGEYTHDALIISPEPPPKYIGLPPRRNSWVAAFPLATCDGFFYRNQEVAVIGGGNTAVEEALYLANIASKVTLVHRRNKFRAEKILIDKMMEKVAAGKIVLELDATLDEVLGDDSGVTGMRIRSMTSDDTREIALKGVFIAIGHKPNTDIFEGQLEMEVAIITTGGREGNATATSIPRHLCGRGRPGPYLPAGRYQCRNRLHGGARCRALPGFAQARLSASMPRRPPHARTLPASSRAAGLVGRRLRRPQDLRGTLRLRRSPENHGKPEATNRQAEGPPTALSEDDISLFKALSTMPRRCVPANRVVLEPPKPAPLPDAHQRGRIRAKAHKHGPLAQRRHIPVRMRDVQPIRDTGPARPPRAGGTAARGAMARRPKSALQRQDHARASAIRGRRDDPALLDWAPGHKTLKAGNRAVVADAWRRPPAAASGRSIGARRNPRNPLSLEDRLDTGG